jgi:MoxR-like ATPase
MLGELLGSVRSTSEGRLVLVSGEAGVGKTALLRSFCDALGPRTRVLWGNCDPLFTPRPLGPLLAVAERARRARVGRGVAARTGGGFGSRSTSADPERACP